MATFVPAEVFPPGVYIQDELDERGWTQADLADVMGRPVQAINEIVKAKKRITEDTAKELELALGIDAEMWIKMEALYRLHRAEPAPSDIAKRRAIRERVPLSQMTDRGWIEPTGDVRELETRVCRFLRVPSLNERFPMALAAKQTDYEAEQLTPAQEAWLLRVRQIASGMPCQPYAEAKLRHAVGQMRRLLAEPEEIRHVPRLLAEAGVRFVLVEQLPSLKVDGVCFWLDDVSPVIGMSLRFDRIDNFWFVLRHEIEHVLNRDGTVLDTELEKRREHVSAIEQRANAAAADFCVPQDMMTNFMDRVGPLYYEHKVVAFAKNIGVHPGLVAGQLRHRLNRHQMFGKLLVKIRHIITPNAVVDGWGSILSVG